MKETKECPNCHKVYTTVLDRQHPEKCIQEEFPNAPKWQREQFLTRLCSDKCWDEYLGLDVARRKEEFEKQPKACSRPDELSDDDCPPACVFAESCSGCPYLKDEQPSVTEEWIDSNAP